MKKRVFVSAMLLLAVCTVLSAETISVAGSSDFDELTALWSKARESDSYTDYQDKLVSISQSVIPDELYQYMLGEALFYKYYACSFIKMPENEELDASLTSTIEYCSTVESEYPVLRTVFELFRSLQKTAPFRNLTVTVYTPEMITERPVEAEMLPDAAAGRMLMLRTLAEVEAMSQRFKLASESRGGEVLLKFSKEAFMNVMEKPAMVYVIKNEPLYAELKDVLERSSDDVETETYGAVADAFYRFEDLVEQCEYIASVKGIPLSEVLSEEAWTAMMLYHTDPFAILSLNETALSRLNDELSYVAEKTMQYADRINELAEKRDGSR